MHLAVAWHGRIMRFVDGQWLGGSPVALDGARELTQEDGVSMFVPGSGPLLHGRKRRDAREVPSRATRMNSLASKPRLSHSLPGGSLVLVQ